MARFGERMEVQVVLLRCFALAHYEISKVLAGFAVARVSRKLCFEDFENLPFPSILGMKFVETLTVKATAEVKIVFSRRSACERNLRDVWPRAAIRASAHPDSNRLPRKTGSPEYAFELADKVG